MIVKAKKNEYGYNELVPSGTMKYIHFGLLKLRKAEKYRMLFEDEETVLVLLNGQVSFDVNVEKYKTGIRKDIFNTNAWALYLPANTEVIVESFAETLIAVALAPSKKEYKPVFITPDNVNVRSVGAWNWRRDVKDIVDTRIAAERLLVGETVNPPGNWSSWPPHKHDVNDYPNESKMEEIYYFRVNPPNGFGIQRIYNNDFDEVHVIKDGDIVPIYKGYHPVAAAPGCQVYYLWILAGEERILLPNDDPNMKWQKIEEQLVKEIRG